MITTKQETAIRDMLASMPELAVGLGTKEQACSLGALNLALTGMLTDEVPECMSVVIGRWVIRVQDMMLPADRDSAAWRGLLVLAAGTGRAHEPARIAIVMDWMWDALATRQSHADAHGFGEAWATMLRERTPLSARAADVAADADAAAEAADAAAYAAAAVATSAYAAAATYAGAAAAAYAVAGTTLDPVSLLRRLVAVTDDRALAVAP